jgi:hypothetical protein
MPSLAREMPLGVEFVLDRSHDERGARRLFRRKTLRGDPPDTKVIHLLRRRSFVFEKPTSNHGIDNLFGLELRADEESRDGISRSLRHKTKIKPPIDSSSIAPPMRRTRVTMNV